MNTCVHGDRKLVRGTSAKGPWAAYMCPTPKGTPDQCAPVWLDPNTLLPKEQRAAAAPSRPQAPAPAASGSSAAILAELQRHTALLSSIATTLARGTAPAAQQPPERLPNETEINVEDIPF